MSAGVSADVSADASADTCFKNALIELKFGMQQHWT